MTIPTDEMLEELAAIGYELPENPNDVFWFMETNGSPATIDVKWVEYNQIPLYFKNYRFMGMSVKRQYPHFLHRDVEKRMENAIV